MRYGPEHKAQTRERILDAAARVFRRRGYQAAGVDEVMAEAGLTPGGFYAHFKSKDELFAEAFLRTLERAKVVRGRDDEALTGPDRVRSIARKYLSAAHRVGVDDGCVLPPLLADLPRRDASAREGFQEVLRATVASLQEHFPERDAERRWDRALAAFAAMVGGMSLARAVADEALAERILRACRALVDAALESPSSSPAKTKPRAASRASSKASRPSSRPRRKPSS